jgi:thiamine-phosphate pyrophosphorylase
LHSKILPVMIESSRKLTERFFDALEAGDIDAATALTTDDVVVDRTSSNAPWGRVVSRGQDQFREGYEEFAAQWDDFGGVRWARLRTRGAGAGRIVVETRISGQGPSTGLPMEARAGWLVSFEGDLVSEAVLNQSFEEALLLGRRRGLEEARLYFVCEAQPHGRDPAELLDAAIRGGVDVIQLREKAPRCAEELIAFADPFARAAREHNVLFFLNDEPGLVEACGADGVHVGQDDEPVAAARAAAGEAALVGLSTHSPEQFDAAVTATGAARPDQVSAGPVWETPTKEGRPAAGLGLIEHAAAAGAEGPPWFAIGGIDLDNITEVAAAGASRIVVVRAVRDANDPEAAARALRAAI